MRPAIRFFHSSDYYAMRGILYGKKSVEPKKENEAEILAELKKEEDIQKRREFWSGVYKRLHQGNEIKSFP
jgi:hypothetical protein